MSNTAVMLCAGRATRMRGTVDDKVLAPLAGRPVLEYALRVFLDSGVVNDFVFVVRDGRQSALIKKILQDVGVSLNKVTFTVGGKDRQDSVYHGLIGTSAETKFVFIHDCARPLISPANLRALLQAVKKDAAAVLAHRATDTIKQTPPRLRSLRRLRLLDLQRETLWAMETPQVFSRDLIIKAYEKVRAKKLRITDDVAAFAILGLPVTIVENSMPNPKLTHPEDFAWVELLLKRQTAR